MKLALVASLLALSLSACSTAPSNQATATTQVPAARIYIKSMTAPASGLTEVQFSRKGDLFFGNAEMLLSINDVVLAEVRSGEKLSLWLKPGTRYTFSVKPVHTLNSPSYDQSAKIDLDLQQGQIYQVRINTGMKGVLLEQGD